MKALIFDNVVVDLAPTEFEVHNNLYWIDADENVKVGWKLVNGNLVEPAQPNYNYKQLRSLSYPQMIDFIDAYYWAQKGDSTKMDEYIAKCDAVKEKYPKGE